MKYNKYWSCLHDNPHHNQVDMIQDWKNHMSKMFDFWPIAYYPFGMINSNVTMKKEGLYPEEEINADWEKIREITNQANQEGFPMFMGYEWQGTGEDGDHNVFFLENHHMMAHPLRYQELYEHFKNENVLAIPHHLAYKIGNRGKNWQTHIESFSPFAEVYSSHGCSESDVSPLSMTTHIHMGPRVGSTSYVSGLKQNIRVGCICSGDNHIAPGQYENGTMCVLATDNSKSAIWDGLKHSRVYGVTLGRMDIDFTLDNQVIGSTIKPNIDSKLLLSIVGDHAIDRVEIYQDEILSKVYTHKGSWEKQAQLQQKVRCKFRTEFGWGPDMREFPDIYKKEWNIQLKTNGQIMSVQKCWNHLGQEILNQTNHEFTAKLTSYKATGQGKWMGQGGLKNEGFVFEIEANRSDDITLVVNGKEYVYSIDELLKTSHLEGDLEGSHQLIESRFGKLEDIRNDAFWHNAYKFKIHQAITSTGYMMNIEDSIDTSSSKQIRIKVYQENGAIAFVSPIYVEE